LYKLYVFRVEKLLLEQPLKERFESNLASLDWLLRVLEAFLGCAYHKFSNVNLLELTLAFREQGYKNLEYSG
jgi:hypothetical protein